MMKVFPNFHVHFTPSILRLHECLGSGMLRAAWRSERLRCCKCDRTLRVKRLNLPRDVLNTAKSTATRSHLSFESALQPVKRVNLKKKTMPRRPRKRREGSVSTSWGVRGRASNIDVRAFRRPGAGVSCPG